MKKSEKFHEIIFWVEGIPRPKQSFDMQLRGERIFGATPARVKAWQNAVAWKAKEVMQGRPPTTEELQVQLTFTLPDRRRRDLDNLSKAVLDGCNKIVWEDDQQIFSLLLFKRIDKRNPGVHVHVISSS